MIMKRYEVVESKRWEGPNGETASIYGAVPYTSEAEKHLWTIKMVGWTVYDQVYGTYGIGKIPWNTREEAQTWVDNEEESRFKKWGPR